MGENHGRVGESGESRLHRSWQDGKWYVVDQGPHREASSIICGVRLELDRAVPVQGLTSGEQLVMLVHPGGSEAAGHGEH